MACPRLAGAIVAIGWRLLATIALAFVLSDRSCSTVTASILVAAIVAATFAPFVLALRGRGWSRIKAAAAVFLGAMLVILATLVIIALAFLPAIKSVVEGITAGIARLKELLTSVNIPPEVGTAIDHVPETVGTARRPSAQVRRTGGLVTR
jgi:predicted PurR-regulated permease PerM